MKMRSREVVMTTHKKMSRVKWMTTSAAVLLLAGGLSVAQAQQGGGQDHNAMDHGGSNQTGASQGDAGQGGMNHGGGMGGMSGGMGGMSHGGGGTDAGGDRHAMMKRMMCRMTEHVEGRLAYLKAELKLNDSQTPQWNLFADAYRAAAQKTAQQCDAMDQHKDHAAHGGILGQLGMMEQHMTAHLDSVRAIKGAIEPFFNSLSEEQKKTANQVMTGMMGLGTGMGGAGMGGMGMGGMGSMQH
jgi:hypothetical protein